MTPDLTLPHVFWFHPRNNAFTFSQTRPLPSLCAPAFSKVGGYSALLDRYHSAVPRNVSSLEPQRYNISAQCYTPRPDAFRLLRDPSSGDLPWPGVLFGIAIVGGWYWCTDQVTAQSFT